MFKKILLPFKNLLVPKTLIKPRIAIGIGSAAKGISERFDDLETVMLGDIMLRHLNGDRAEMTKMPPKEIAALAETVLNEAAATAHVFPGSRNTIADFFIDEKSKMPKKLDVRDASSIFKMALTAKTISDGTPAINSCDASNYPIVLLDGKVSEVPIGEPVEHNGTSSHSITIKKGTWLAKEISKTVNNRDFQGNPFIDDVYSTHPLFPTKLPEGAKVLAVAPDNSACIIAFTSNNIAVVDHPEAGNPTKTDKRRQNEEFELRLFGEVEGVLDDKGNSDALKLWKVIRDKFVQDASLQRSGDYAVSKNKFNSRVMEILESRDLDDLSKTSVFMGGDGKVDLGGGR